MMLCPSGAVEGSRARFKGMLESELSWAVLVPGISLPGAKVGPGVSFPEARTGPEMSLPEAMGFR